MQTEMSMKLGVSVPYGIGAPLDIGELAKRAEGLGFESIWVGEHPVMPVNQATPWRGSSDGTIPESFSHAADPFVTLAVASAVTTTLKVGTGVCLVPEREPIVLAKIIATLDHFSGGRFLFGIGAGWLREEVEIMGGDFPHRWGQTRESVLAMKELWTKEEAEYHGKYYDFPPVRSFPKPAQAPHPPVLLGGNAKNVLKRVVEWGDGWIPAGVTADQVKAARSTLDDLANAAGRDAGAIEISVLGQPPRRTVVETFEDAGAVRLVFALAGPASEDAAAQMEDVARQVLSGS